VLGAVLFREGTRTHFRITSSVGWTFLFVAALHGLWDGVPPSLALVVPPGVHVPLSLLVLSVVGVWALVRLYRRADRQLTDGSLNADPPGTAR
jgi:hypothetical protein